MRTVPILLLALATASGCLAQQAPVTIVDDSVRHELTISIGPLDLPAGGGHAHGSAPMVSPIPEIVEIPVDGSLYSFSTELVDAHGEEVPPLTLHHLNLVDPDQRELFLPIARRVLAVGQETGSQSMPKILFGYPVARGQRLGVSVTLHNPTERDYEGVTVRLHLGYVPPEGLGPLFLVMPFHVDVAFPHNRRDFDLPPGESTAAWEGSPAIPGRIVVMGSHLHEYATRIAFEDVTRGRLIWVGEPILDEDGNLQRAPVEYFLSRLGVKLYPERTYRASVTYHNPTADTIVSGGMGVVAGLFWPDREAVWPPADTTDALYQSDWRHYMAYDKIEQMHREHR
jgi:hypothetical protein